ncbi:Transcription factor IIIB 90 kDa subunit [Spatholobus suberectus]|nr:Transcription factor IIIB 90 kDa subunit [Spatholobus suberectus]
MKKNSYKRYAIAPKDFSIELSAVTAVRSSIVLLFCFPPNISVKFTILDLTIELNMMAKEHEKNPTVMPKDEAYNKDLANASNDRFKGHKEDLPAYMPESIGATNVEHEATKDGKYDDSHREDESETFSDIDDQDVDVYLLDEEGKHIKKILWERANQVYLEEMKQRQAYEAKNLRLARSAAEAVGQMFNKKRHLQSLNSKVNFDRLGELFNELVILS